MRKSTTGGVARRNITLPKNVVDEMEAVREQTGAQSDSEVLRKAFKLYKHVLDNGGHFYTKDEEGKERDVLAL